MIREESNPKPAVSVIVPVYNCERYLRECVDSALGQSLRNLELILVDDGSPDGSGKIVDEYAGKDERVIAIHKENGGQSSARNAGIEVATGDYLYFLDSDDIMEPDLLERVIPLFDHGYEMVVFGFRSFPSNRWNENSGMTSPVKRKELIFNTDKERYEFLSGPFRMKAIRWEVWNRVFRRDMVERWRVRFPKDRRAYPEDLFFTFCYVAHISRILIIPDVLYSYRRREGSVSGEVYTPSKNLMILSSNLITKELGEHLLSSEDCAYLSGRFPVIHYLMHKAAIRRLRRHQRDKRLDISEAREILRDNVEDYPLFIQRMRDAFNSPDVVKSYRKDRRRGLQLVDRLYTGELLEIPASGLWKSARKTLLTALGPIAGR